MEIDRRIVEQYAYRVPNETLEDAILLAIVEAGKDRDRPTLEDLAPLDEFHIGGRRATAELATQMDLRSECICWMWGAVSVAQHVSSQLPRRVMSLGWTSVRVIGRNC
jgi:hypothetical protein